MLILLIFFSKDKYIINISQVYWRISNAIKYIIFELHI